VPVAIVLATNLRHVSGRALRPTEGIYTIMITLAIASAFYYLTLQNYSIFNGFSGFNGIAPLFSWAWTWAAPFRSTISASPAPRWPMAPSSTVARALRPRPSGDARQSPAHGGARLQRRGARIAAYTFASVIAGRCGRSARLVPGQISPGTAGVGPVVDILIIAVVGGLSRPVGPFLGALVYVLLRTFSLDVLESVGLDGKRFQLLIGLGFLLIVLFSPGGLVGIFERLRDRFRGAARPGWPP
jgi:branched-chain amino acid transport system permease protein